MNPHLIQGGRNVHERGSVSFVNGFDFNGVGSGRSHRLLHEETEGTEAMVKAESRK